MLQFSLFFYLLTEFVCNFVCSWISIWVSATRNLQPRTTRSSRSSDDALPIQQHGYSLGSRRKCIRPEICTEWCRDRTRLTRDCFFLSFLCIIVSVIEFRWMMFNNIVFGITWHGFLLQCRLRWIGYYGDVRRVPGLINRRWRFCNEMCCDCFLGISFFVIFLCAGGGGVMLYCTYVIHCILMEELMTFEWGTVHDFFSFNKETRNGNTVFTIWQLLWWWRFRSSYLGVLVLSNGTDGIPCWLLLFSWIQFTLLKYTKIVALVYSKKILCMLDLANENLNTT